MATITISIRRSVGTLCVLVFVTALGLYCIHRAKTRRFPKTPTDALWLACEVEMSSYSASAWIKIEMARLSTEKPKIELFDKAVNDLSRKTSYIYFCEALQFMRVEDYEGADRALDCALQHWPNRIEYAFAKLICRRAIDGPDSVDPVIAGVLEHGKDSYVASLCEVFASGHFVDSSDTKPIRREFLRWMANETMKYLSNTNRCRMGINPP